MLTQLAAATADSLDAAADNAWSAVGVIGGAVGAAIIYGIVQLIKAWRAPTPRTETIAGERYDVTGMSESLVTMLSNALTEARAAREENEAHEERIGALENTQGQLAGHIILLRRGIEDGTIPPLPPTPEEIAHLLQLPPSVTPTD